jgi:hypothetical protein
MGSGWSRLDGPVRSVRLLTTVEAIRDSRLRRFTPEFSPRNEGAGKGTATFSREPGIIQGREPVSIFLGRGRAG